MWSVCVCEDREWSRAIVGSPPWFLPIWWTKSLERLLQWRQSCGWDRRKEGMNRCLEMNYRHTLVSAQRGFHAHPKASHHVFACIHITSLIRSLFLISSDGMKGQWRDNRKYLFLPYLSSFSDLLILPPLHHFFHFPPFLHRALFSFHLPPGETSAG